MPYPSTLLFPSPSTVFPGLGVAAAVGTFASYRQFVGIALEATPGTPVPMTNTMIVEKFDFEDKPKWLDDKGWRQWFSTLAARQVGPIINEFSMSGHVYGDVWPFALANILGDVVGTGTANGAASSLSASAAAGATSVTITTPPTSGDIVQIDTGALAEIRKFGTSGAFAVGERPLIYAHASAAVTQKLQAPYTSAFSVNNFGQATAAVPYQQGQPPTHTITHYQGVSPTYGARVFPGACCSELNIEFNAETELLKWDSKWVAWPSVLAGAAVTSAPSSVTPIASWRGKFGFAGPATGGTQVTAIPSGKFMLKRQVEPDFTVQGTQAPYIIQRGPLDLTGTYEIIAADESHYNYMINNTQPQIQFVLDNGLSGVNDITITYDIQQSAINQAKMDSSKANIRYQMAFESIANTTNAGGTGGGSPCKVTVKNGVPANVYM